MFQSDKPLKQSVITLSQLGTVFLCRHQLVFPAASAPNKAIRYLGKNPKHPSLCLILGNRTRLRHTMGRGRAV